ncbi:hypothetical protein [Moraxella boevrei]|uniref:hypothetical protein n=1 Tax=Faucicola boevrei TaxID=346665 RepID=UPI003734CF51
MAMSTILVKSFQVTALASALALVGCGSGGNDTLPAKSNGNNSSNSNSDSNSGNGTSKTTSSVNVNAITLTDVNGNITSTVTSSNNVTASIKVTDASGNPISGALVTFTAGGVTFGTSNGAVLSNAEGIAKISLKPTDVTDTGAYTISATAEKEGVTATSATVNFSLQSANITIGNLNIANENLASGGSTNITLVTTDGTNVQNGITVDFNATCGSFSANPVTSSNQGNVTTTYSAIDSNGNLCEGSQTITAKTTNGSDTKTLTVNVAQVQPSALLYTSTEAVNLVTKNSGSATTGQIEFTVYANGSPVRNQKVIISKIETPNDFSFGVLNNQSPIEVESDSNGKVIVNLYPGALPGPVELRATLKNDSNVTAVSKNIAVIGSRATQNGITVGIGKNVLLNDSADTTNITMRITNRNGTSIPAGTTVNFVSEGGMITPSCSTDATGNCTVTFTSQNPRPANGRVSILAYLEGDKQYTDINGDNMYTAGTDTFVKNIGDLFRDDNENNIYDSANGEFIYKRNGSGSCGTNTSVRFDQLSISTLGSFLNFFAHPNINDSCTTDLSATLREQFIIGLADDTPTFVGLNPTSNGLNTFYMYGNNLQTVSMPSGTTIAVEAEDKTPDNKLTCEAEFRSGDLTVPALVNLSIVNDKGNYFQNTDAVKYSLKVSGCASADKVKVIVNAPNGKNTTNIFEWN